MRVVSLLPSATEVIAELGLLESIVAVSDDCNWPPEVAGKPVAARSRLDVAGLTSAEIDQVVRRSAAAAESLYAIDAALLEELRPDLVITQDLCQVCAVSSGDLATACPVQAEVLSMTPRTLAEVIGSVVSLAERLGVRDHGLAVATAMQETIDRVRRAIAGLERPRAFVAEWIDPPYTAGHWVPEMVEAAGGYNLLSAPGGHSVATSWPTVLAAQPDLVVVAACGFGLEQALERAAWLDLPVRTVVVDGDAYFSRPGPRLADGVRQLAHLLHPATVADPGLPCAELRPAATSVG